MTNIGKLLPRVVTDFIQLVQGCADFVDFAIS
jgi:hypothetical protein